MLWRLTYLRLGLFACIFERVRRLFQKFLFWKKSSIGSYSTNERTDDTLIRFENFFYCCEFFMCFLMFLFRVIRLLIWTAEDTCNRNWLLEYSFIQSKLTSVVWLFLLWSMFAEIMGSCKISKESLNFLWFEILLCIIKYFVVSGFCDLCKSIKESWTTVTYFEIHWF